MTCLRVSFRLRIARAPSTTPITAHLIPALDLQNTLFDDEKIQFRLSLAAMRLKC